MLALSELEAKSGNPEGAEDLRSQANEIVGYISQHIYDEELKRAFLAQSEVQRVQAHR
jgi:hypothetical protein